MILRFTQYDIARALESTYKRSTGVDICIEAFDVVIDKITYCSGSSPLEIEISLDPDEGYVSKALAKNG